MPCTLWYTVPCPCNFACFLAFLLASLLCFDYCSACLDVLDASAWLLRCFAGLAALLLWCLLLLWCFDLGPKNKSLQLQDGVRVLFCFFSFCASRASCYATSAVFLHVGIFVPFCFFRKTMILHYEAECSYFFILCLAGLRVLCLNCVAAYAYFCALPYSLKPDHFKYRAECSYFFHFVLCGPTRLCLILQDRTNSNTGRSARIFSMVFGGPMGGMPQLCICMCAFFVLCISFQKHMTSNARRSSFFLCFVLCGPMGTLPQLCICVCAFVCFAFFLCFAGLRALSPQLCICMYAFLCSA